MPLSDIIPNISPIVEGREGDAVDCRSMRVVADKGNPLSHSDRDLTGCAHVILKLRLAE